MSVVAFVRSDDWQAMYIDGELVVEGHSIPQREIIQALIDHVQDLSLTIVPETYEIDVEWLEENGWEFPQKLSDGKYQ